MLSKARTIDLDKYLGKWYQIAAFPAWFQRGCDSTTAFYRKVNDYISIFNTCRSKNGIKNTAFGAAKPFSRNVLKVQFFPLISADYTIEFVDEEYQHAVVGSGKKKYLWILAREKSIPCSVYDELVKIAKKKGYDVKRLVKT